MRPRIVGLCQLMSNKMQLYIVYFTRKLLYMFRMVFPPIIRSTNNCVYSIWHLTWVFLHLLGCFYPYLGVFTLTWVFLPLLGCFYPYLGVFTLTWVLLHCVHVVKF